MFSIFKKFFARNYLASIYFNFKMLPFSQAIKLPFMFYHRVRFENLSGKISIQSSELYLGMIKIGGRGSEMFYRSETILDIKGQVIFKKSVEIGHGSLIRVEKSGLLSFSNYVRIGAYTKIFCEDEIHFEDKVGVSWECQIFDTNFHDMINLDNSALVKRTIPIRIGEANWIGNRVTIMKGTITPSNTIVASNSLCNKNYLEIEQFSILAGSPAKQVSKNTQRVFEF